METKATGGGKVPRWAYGWLGVVWYVTAAGMCWEALLPTEAHGTRTALAVACVLCWLPVMLTIGVAMTRSSLAFQRSWKTARDVAQTNVGEMTRAVYGACFPGRDEGFSTGFLVFYYVGMAVFAAGCVAHPVLILAPWR